MENSDLALSVVLGGTKCNAALVSSNGELIKESASMLGGASATGVASLIMEQVETLLAHAALKHLQVCGVGISVPGIYDQQRGTVWAPHIDGWEKYPLHRFLKDHLTRHDLPLLIESERGASMLGEYWLGASKGIRDAIFFSAGKGIGAGILSDGRLVRGAHDNAGAAGWMALQRPFEAKFKRFGNFEYYASGDGLVRAAMEMNSRSSSRFFQKESRGDLKTEELFVAYEKRDPVAIKVIDQAIELWGMACANMVSLLNPEIIVFGGEVFGPGVQFLERIYREAIRWAQPVAMRRVRFLPSELKENAPLQGIAYQLFQFSTES